MNIIENSSTFADETITSSVTASTAREVVGAWLAVQKAIQSRLYSEMNSIVISSVEGGIMYVRQEVSVIAQCACAYTFCIGSLFVQNITGTSGRPAISGGPTKKNRLCHFSKQTLKFPVLEILKYTKHKMINKENLRLLFRVWPSFKNSGLCYCLQAHIVTVYKHAVLLSTITHSYWPQAHIVTVYKHTLLLSTSTHCYCLQAHIFTVYKHAFLLSTATHYCCLQAHIFTVYKHTSLLSTSTQYYCLQAHIVTVYKHTLLLSTSTRYYGLQAHIVIVYKHAFLL